MEILYTAEATATGAGREGEVRTSDGVLHERLELPVTMGGSGDRAVNPEQLFAAGYAACFHNAVLWSARLEGLEPHGSSVTARVGIGRQGPGFGLTVVLRVDLPGVARAAAERIAAAAHRGCPYSRAIQGNVDVDVVLVEHDHQSL